MIRTRTIVFAAALDTAIIIGAFFAFDALRGGPVGYERFGRGGMTLTSPAFAMNGPIPKAYSCDGDAGHPPLTLQGVPPGTLSIAIVAEDPDMPLGGRIHWVVWNLPPADGTVAAGVLPPSAIEGRNSFGRQRYDGPCPPLGVHRFVFRAYAFDSGPPIDMTADAATLEGFVREHMLAQAALVGTYGR